MKTHLCTTGTSIARGIDPALFGENPENYRRAIQQRVAKEQESGDFLQKISAETNGLSRCGIGKADEVILIHTETGDGEICAEAVRDLVTDAWGCDCRLVRVEGLQVRDPRKFRKEGVQNLFRSLDRLRNERWGRELLLNVTGGFKAVVPFMTLYGLIHRLDVVYLYETSSELITLPPVPVSFDFERLGAFRDAMRRLQAEQVMPLTDFEKLIPADVRQEAEWMQALVDVEEDMVSPSGLAPLFFKELDEHAAQVLISPQAEASLAASSGGLRKQYLGMLERVVDPLWRDSKIHPVHGTDLSVFKPGNTSARMIAFLKGRRVYVCELALHDRYEELLAGKRVSDYPENCFQTYQAPADASDLPASEERAVEELDLRLAEKTREIEGLFCELEEKENLYNRVIHEARTNAAREKENAENLRTRLQEVQTQIQSYAALPAWKRLFQRPPVFSSDNSETR